MITASQLLCHLIGDYFLQSEWMVRNKKQSVFVATVHGLVYSLPFLILDITLLQYLLIATSHAVIDRWGEQVIGGIVKLKNLISPLSGRVKNPNNYGFPEGTPDYVQFFVVIVIDNTLHIVCNALILSVLI
ncbi:TMhelix containing protein [Vibrio phage 1.101.O._10N.261.45.C6]|nr:TMhelix containing protein [Vibrio phage 1.101.O._10N.261.45.C6]